MQKGGGITGDGLGTLAWEIRNLKARLDELEKPTGDERAGTLAHLASLFTVSQYGQNFNTGDTPGDQTFRWTENVPAHTLTLTAATGRVLLTFGCSQATLSPGEVSAIVALSPVGSTASGWSMALETLDTRLYSTSGYTLGAPLVSSVALDVPSGEPVTFDLEIGIWSASTATLANAQIALPYITAQVIN